MKYKIYRTNGNVLCSVKIECGREEPESVKMGAAIKKAVSDGVDLTDANLSRANLSGANLICVNLAAADLSEVNLSGACLSYANFSYADLSRANLSCAILSGVNFSYAGLAWANLSYADLTRVILNQANLDFTNFFGAIGIIDGGRRSDGYRFIAVRHADGIRFFAGCRWFTKKEAYEHWKEKRGGTFLGEETFDRLEMMERNARRYGWTIE